MARGWMEKSDEPTGALRYPSLRAEIEGPKIPALAPRWRRSPPAVLLNPARPPAASHWSALPSRRPMESHRGPFSIWRPEEEKLVDWLAAMSLEFGI